MGYTSTKGYPVSTTVVVLTEPDLSIPFNDGVELESGYGTFDANGNKAVDFTRASSTGNINKSSVSETLAINEPGITKDGLSIYESYTNYFDAPEAAVTQVQTIGADTYTLWILGAGSATTTYGVATEASPLTFTSAGEALTVTIAGVVDLCNLIDLYKIAPPLLDVVAPVTRAADVATIPMMNNMPAPGQPFTIMCDAAIPLGGVDATNHGVFSESNSGPISGVQMWRKGNTDALRVVLGTGTSIVTSEVLTFDDEINRIAFVYDGSTQKIYINGVISDSQANLSATYDLNGELELGTKLTSSHLNSEIKKFKIFHKALTAEEIAALGAAE